MEKPRIWTQSVLVTVLIALACHEVPAVDPVVARQLADTEARIRAQATTEAYRGIATARRLLEAKKHDEANRLLADLEQQTPDLFALVQVYRTQATAAMAQTNQAAAVAAYQKIFDLVLKPEATPEEIAKVSSTVLNVFQTEYRGMLLRFKLPPPSAKLRAALAASTEAFGDTSGKPKAEVQSGLAIEQLELARALIKEGKRKDGLAAYEVLFTKYPDFLMSDGLIINTRFAWIEAHGYQRGSVERIALLQKVYADPAYKKFPRIANIGVHLGHAYMVTRHPNEELHWKALIEQIEEFQKQPPKERHVAELLVENYQGALMQYASCLDRREERGMLREVVKKLEANFANDEGGKTALRLKAKLGAPK